MAHTCNPSYAGGRDQEDHSLKPARAIVQETLSQKKKITKRGWWALSSNLSTAKKKKRKERGILSDTGNYNAALLVCFQN
jgi:hypothetical protein